jgi:hypothetical protein
MSICRYFWLNWDVAKIARTLDRTCPICHKTWLLDYPGVGRPRVYCLACQPEGLKVVRVSQVKLRRDPYRRWSEAGAA